MFHSLSSTCTLLLLLPLLGVTMCNRKQAGPTKVEGPAAAVQTTVYQSRGVVKSIKANRPSIELDHEDIPGLMPAMTMEFYVKDKSLLKGLKPGDHIDFTIENGVGGVKITEIRRR